MKRIVSIFIVLVVLFSYTSIIYAQDSNMGNCPYSINEIVSARDTLAKYARWLFNAPMNWDAALNLEIALAKVNQIESISRCEGTRNILANAKLMAQQAKDNQNYHLELHRKTMESLNDMQRDIWK